MPEPDLDRGGKPLLSGGIWDKKATDLVGFYLGEAGSWLGDAAWEASYPIRAAGDTALSLGTGMLNMTASAAAAVPSMLTSDDPFTREGSKEWRDKLMGTSEALDPYTWDAKTDFGKDVTGAIGGAIEFWNEEVAFPIGKGVGKLARNIFGMDQKASERLESGVVGVLTGAPGALSILRVKTREKALPTNTGNLKVDTANARTNAIANVQSTNYVANNWKTIDPTGYAKAVKDGTLQVKISEYIKEMSKIIDETPVNLVKPEEIGHLGEMKRDIRDASDPALKGLTGDEWWLASKKADINVSPEMMDRVRREELGTAGSLEVLGHEFSHLQDWLNYEKLVPSRNPKDPAFPTPKNPGTGDINPATGKPWSKEFWGMGTEGMPAVNALSKILEEGVAKKDLETKLTSPTEVHSRLNNMQRTLSEKNMDFRDIIDWDFTTDAVWTKEVYKMPYDVMHMVKKIDEAVARGVVSKKAVLESLVAALEESRVYHPTKLSLGIIGR
jgi:hypothetical protein